MRSRRQTQPMRPVRNQKYDTQPMRPVRRQKYDTQPMQPVRQGGRVKERYQTRRSNIDSSYQRGTEYNAGRVYQMKKRDGRAGQEEYEHRHRAVQRSPKIKGTARYKTNSSKSGISRLFVESDAQFFDYELLLIILFLMCFGLIMLYSVSAYSAQNDFKNDMYYFSKQAIVGVISFAWMFFVSKIDYHVYGAFSFEIYVLAMIMMALVQTPLGVEAYGARRWIQLPGNMTLQPSEITKIAVILFISYELCRLGKKAITREGTIRVIMFGAIAAAGVLFLTDNLSTAIIVMAITCILYFVIHPKLKPFIQIVAVGAAVIAVGVMALAVVVGNSTSENFRIRRILTWLDPENNADTGGFQVMQGLYAIGSGGFFGKGLGNSTQKLGVIPEVQNDMILTVICEELGVFGVIVILVLFAFMLYRLMFVAQNAPDLYGSLIVTGVFGHIALQVILNICVVTNMIPTTGVTLPFFSYGGTSVLFLMTEMGIALGVSRKIKIKED